MDVLQAILILIFFGILRLAPSENRRLLLFIGIASIISAFVPCYSEEQAITNAMAIDSFLCLAMYFSWSTVNSMRCYAVGLIGLFKNGLGFSMLASGLALMPWEAYAYSIAFALIAQMLAAGGLLNDLGSWLDDRLLQLNPKRHGLLRNSN